AGGVGGGGGQEEGSGEGDNERAPPPASATGEAGRGAPIDPDRWRRSRWCDDPLPASPVPADGRGGGVAQHSSRHHGFWNSQVNCWDLGSASRGTAERVARSPRARAWAATAARWLWPSEMRTSAATPLMLLKS